MALKPRDEAHACLDEWLDDGAVGTLTLYHPPNVAGVDVIEEQVIKAREMDQKTREAFIYLMESTGAEKGEFFRGADGKPDRIKIVKRI